jgi:hypothetical protein
MSHRLLALDLERGRWLGSLEAAEPLLALRATEDGATLVTGDHQGAVSWLDATGWAEAAPAAP